MQRFARFLLKKKLFFPLHFEFRCVIIKAYNVSTEGEIMKELTKREEKRVYKILKALFLALSILLFIIAENYLVAQLSKSKEVAAQDLVVACEQTADGKYYVSTEYGHVNVYNGTGRNIKDLILTAHYITMSGKEATSHEVQAGDFEPYMLDGKFNAYQLSFYLEPKKDVLSDAKIIWLEFEVESYELEWTMLDYLMIGVFVIACVSTAMYFYSKKILKDLEKGEAESIAIIGEETVE